MERVLRVYGRPLDPRFPVVCLDEAGTALREHVRAPLPMTPGHPVREDYEEARGGFANLLLFVAPFLGYRQILVTQPSLLGLQILLDLSQRPEGGAGTAADLDEAALRTLVKRQAQKMSRYVCSVCGFRAQHYYWQCPGCSRWDSYSPQRTEEQETAA